MNKKIVSVIIVVAVGAYFFAAPFLTLNNIQEGIIEQDQDSLADDIDFPALRESLKGQMSVMIAKKVEAEASDNPFAAIGAMLGAKMVDGMVDSLVTPAGLAQMVTRGEEQGDGGGGTRKKKSNESQVLANAESAWTGLSKFTITIPDESGEPDLNTYMILTRDGLFSWRLTNMILPKTDL